MKRTFAALLAAIILVPTFTYASTPDPSCPKLFNNCHTAKNTSTMPTPPHSTILEKMKVAACVGYFEGFTDREAVSNMEGAKQRFCPPPDDNITAEEKILIFLQWGDRNPQLLHIDRVTCVTEAFADAYPCPPRK